MKFPSFSFTRSATSNPAPTRPASSTRWAALCGLFAAALCLAPTIATAQTTLLPGEWTWMGGSDTGNASSVYGTQGTPAKGNVPGARFSFVRWTDKSGNLWLFGGQSYYINGNSTYLNDLWEFNPTTNEWTWVSGSNTANASGVYGTQGTPAKGNVPGARSGSVSWTDKSGNLWLFGGSIVDAKGNTSDFNDLWEFNPTTNEWTWVSGSNTGNVPGVYGTQGTPAKGNVPGARYSPVTWIDQSGNFWLFGGYGDDVNGNTYDLNDLWEFNPTTNEWVWISGSDTKNASGVYGTQGVPAKGNVPGARQNSVSWIDKNGNLWLFGGYSLEVDGSSGYLNDLWEFNLTTNEWTWISGSNTVNASGVYGTQGVPAKGNVPSARQSSDSWTDKNGNLWLFGGSGIDVSNTVNYLNDLWEFNPTTNEWTWMSGSNTANASGVYGTQGTPAKGNVPGARFGSASWTDQSGNLWLFGGTGVNDQYFDLYDLNDLWEFNTTTNEWAWMGGSDTIDELSIYGTQGTPAAGNAPGARENSVSWTDQSGNLWLFGGIDVYANFNGDSGIYNDLWKYTPDHPAALTAPTPSSTLTSSSATFTWTKGTNISAYALRLGTTGPGSDDLDNSGTITALTYTATNLPTNGAKIYARLYSKINVTWVYNDYTFTAESLATVPATLTAPTPSSTLTSSSATFTWTKGTNISSYALRLGTTGPGSDDLDNSGTITALTYTATNLPTTGVKIYARLYSKINVTWVYTDYTFTAK